MATNRLAAKLIIFLISTFLSFAIVAKPDENNPQSFDKTKFAQQVERGMQLWNMPAMAVAVVSSDSIQFQQGFGQTAIAKGKKVDEHTIFAIASTTKAMVVASILILVDEKKLSLDDLVIKHIPELHLNSEELTQQITIRDLLSHRTGLPSTDLWAFLQRNSLDDQIKRLRHVKSVSPLGSRFIYQNTMYELAGVIIERVSGKPWNKFVKNRLWKAIGMNETYANRADIARRKNQVLPYLFVDEKLKQASWNFDKNLNNAAGSVWSSIHDMSLWAQFLLNDGVTKKGKQLISKESIELMFEPQQLISKRDFYPVSQITQPHWRSYGLAWFQQDFQGRKIDYHTGSLAGLIAMIGLDRESDKAFIALGNRDHAETRHALLWWVMDQHKPEDKQDWNQQVFDLFHPEKDGNQLAEDKRNASRLKNTKPGLELAEYTGTYTNAVQGSFSINLEGDQLTALYGQDVFKIKHWHLDTFEMIKQEWDFRVFVSFNISPSGIVESVTLFGEKYNRVVHQEK